MKELRVEKNGFKKLLWRNGFMKELLVEQKTSKDCFGEMAS